MRLFLVYSVTWLSVCCFTSFVSGNSEYFSSTDQLQILGNLEGEMLNVTKNYVIKQEQVIARMKNFIKAVRTFHTLAEKDVEDQLGDPINAFKLINRLLNDWKHIHLDIESGSPIKEFTGVVNELRNDVQLPTENDLRGAIIGLNRLQDTYLLSAGELTDGIIGNSAYETQLTWYNCFEIASTLMEVQKYEAAIEWLNVTLTLLNGHIDDLAPEKKLQGAILTKYLRETMEYMAMAYFKMGNNELANEYLAAISDEEIEPNVLPFWNYLNSDYTAREPPIKAPIHDWQANYTRLCRGERLNDRPHEMLHCHLSTNGHPYFVLAPLQIEEVNLNPEIKLYHNLFNDAQIEQIFEEADKSRMERSRVVGDVKLGTSLTSEVRVSQQIWLNYSSKIMKNVKYVVSALSGFDMQNAETMQVANYGIGGQYEPHHDYFNDNDYNKDFPGDRITTNMIYFSDVEQGGYTVFPYLDVFSKPKKGSMVVWYNLHRSLQPDPRTLHAGCPVLVGSKRIGNIWIHSYHQEFRRPCALTRSKEELELTAI